MSVAKVMKRPAIKSYLELLVRYFHRRKANAIFDSSNLHQVIKVRYDMKLMGHGPYRYDLYLLNLFDLFTGMPIANNTIESSNLGRQQ